MTRFILVLFLVTFALPVYAQEHATLVAQVKQQLELQGVNLSGACGASAINVRVAYKLRNEGYGLLVKTAGNRAVYLSDGRCVSGDDSNLPGFATDYVIQHSTGFGYDTLGDGGGANTPQWAGPETDQEMVIRNLQNFAVAPNLDAGAPTPAPVPVPTPAPVPVPPTTGGEYKELLERIIALQESQILKIDEVITVGKDTNERVKNIDRTFTQTLGNFSKFAAKYIAPAIAGFIAAKKTGN